MYDLFMKKQKPVYTVFLWKCQDSETSSDVELQVDREDDKTLELVFCKVTFQLMSQFVLPAFKPSLKSFHC